MAWHSTKARVLKKARKLFPDGSRPRAWLKHRAKVAEINYRKQHGIPIKHHHEKTKVGLKHDSQ
jgi:hypothetical protein